MNKKKMIVSVAMIVLLPLLSALMYVGYDLYIPIILRCTELEMVRRIIVLAIPAALIIYYGYTTENKIVSTLSGALLIPIFNIYSEILFELLDPDFIMSSLHFWLRWERFIDLAPPMLIYGLMGYFASRGTKISLVVAISLGILMVLLILGID